MKLTTPLAAAAATVALLPGVARAANGAGTWARAGCGGCHTLAAAGATGQVGPNLDVLRPSTATVAAQVSSGGGGMPSFASTLSASDIQALAAWVASSAGNTGAAAGAGSAAASLSTSATTKLQRDLLRLGYFHGPVTGFYGPLTTVAVKRFQRSAGLTVDGIWGSRSAAALRQRLH